MNYSYKNSGVNIEEGDKLVDDIKTLTSSKKNNAVLGNIGGFGALFDLKATGFKDPILVSGTDGVGTKLKVALDTEQYDTIGIDLVAMCVNDVLTHGAKPLFFLDYYATGKLDRHIAKQVIKGISDGCHQADCQLIGGETAEMPGLYSHKDFDLAGFTVGAVERNDILPKKESIQPGDLILGLPSSGFHSNGYSLVRKVVEDFGFSYQQEAPFDQNQTLGQALLAPTKIYVQDILPIAEKKLVKAMAHITGGGLTGNMPRILPPQTKAIIHKNSWDRLPMFDWLQKTAMIDDKDMFQTFNMGIGFVLVCSEDNLEPLLSTALPFKVIGKIEKYDREEPICDIL